MAPQVTHEVLSLCANKMSPSNDNHVQEKLKDSIKLYNKASSIYKEGQQLFLKIDERIHNEFQYASRASITILENLQSEDVLTSNNDFSLAVDDLYTACRNILIDAVDLVYLYASDQTRKLNDICDFSSVVDVYPKYHEIHSILKNASEFVPITREKRGEYRMAEYETFAFSEDYRKLIEYCNYTPEIRNLLKKKHASELNSNNNFILSIIFGAILGVIASVVGSVAYNYYIL